MTEVDLPPWLTVGASVAEFAYGRAPGRPAVSGAKVVKIGKRDIVLDNGERYNVHRLQRWTGGTYGTTWYLRPQTDTEVQAAFALGRRDRAVRDVTKLLSEWAANGDPDTLQKVLNRLVPFQVSVLTSK